MSISLPLLMVFVGTLGGCSNVETLPLSLQERPDLMQGDDYLNLAEAPSPTLRELIKLGKDYYKEQTASLEQGKALVRERQAQAPALPKKP